ncbi:MAG TPA: carbamoyltransferase HypF [Candidatus Deferrimicrobium sp.]|nr:carbamoyltransferase HypF [Candidatus Deferrimicrobium sp.]
MPEVINMSHRSSEEPFALPDQSTNGKLPSGSISLRRARMTIRGAVQGVGFRPFVYRLARDLSLAGFVRNTPQGVVAEVEGSATAVTSFLTRVLQEAPRNARIEHHETYDLAPLGLQEFRVLPSEHSGEKSAVVLPDMAACPECLQEIFDAANRRFRYPFTNCTNCGPRYSIIEALPYDRQNTTMRTFPMCRDCQTEYEDPSNRRFHAQPNACPVCGPQLELWDLSGKTLSTRGDALIRTCEYIRAGQIVALKGLGGFQLLVDARNAVAVQLLRSRKGREEKPFALMYPSLPSVEEHCFVSAEERDVSCSTGSPIVLLSKRPDASIGANGIAADVAPDNPYLGVMMPYTPLHHLLMAELGFPIVATSGNLSDEPICIDEHEALARLGGFADFFLVHNRPIARQVDDSVVRILMKQPMPLRMARGYAPVAVSLPAALPDCLAVGAHLKNTVAIAKGGHAYVSQHIGDLETRIAYDAFTNVVQSLSRIYDFEPQTTACDLHPDYPSTTFALEQQLPTVKVQHHYAHVLSCMIENDLSEPVLGIAWDGTGLGTDGTIWGGEFLRVDDRSFERVGHLRPFRLPGGDAAVREPRRTAIGLLYEVFGPQLFEMRQLKPIQSFSADELRLLPDVLARGVNCPVTSSAGRLFDAVSSLLGLCQHCSFEGQAAMKVEFAIAGAASDGTYDYVMTGDAPPYILDWESMIRQILADLHNAIPAGVIAAKFHNTLVEMIVSLARRMNEKIVVLSGGCFQNAYLTARAIRRLSAAGFTVYRHHRVPPNDGGIALGQIAEAARAQRKAQ